MIALQAGHGVDGDLDDLFWMGLRDLLDLHAALGRDHQGDARCGAVDQHAGIEFARDVAAILDIDALDLAPLRPCLVRHQYLAQHILGPGAYVLDGLHHLDPARLAAPARMDLRLHHIDRPA